MRANGLNLPGKTSVEGFRVSGRGCGHCETRARLLQSEETCPETYRCPLCKAQWILRGHITISTSELDAMSDAEFNELVRQDGLQALRILLD
jgi:hypothetical protein